MQLLFGDMRTMDVPEPVDILISELLGSFGDNELSPECLDGAQRFLKRKSFHVYCLLATCVLSIYSQVQCYKTNTIDD